MEREKATAEPDDMTIIPFDHSRVKAATAEKIVSHLKFGFLLTF